LLLLEGIDALVERLHAVLERLDIGGDVLGSWLAVRDCSTVASSACTRCRRVRCSSRIAANAALRRGLADLAFEPVNAIREPLDAHWTCALPVPVAGIIEHRPQRDAERREREHGDNDQSGTRGAQPVQNLGP
jgi:hypothetical protein